MGLVLLVAPWSSLWDSNWLLQSHPALQEFALSAFTRGAVTGLGMVNIVVALHDLREHLVATARRR